LTSAERVATYKGDAFVTSKGAVSVASLVGAPIK
jgi:hypothetical protein